jgi:tRNA pseudouridine55 synthase
MDGKPLYEYARTNTPLPRPIEARKCTVLSLELVDWQDTPGSHDYNYPTAHVEDLAAVEKLEQMVRDQAVKSEAPEEPVETPVASASSSTQEKPEGFPPCFTLKMTVSSGTYVRSIAHDLGIALGSLAHVVRLERTRQGDYSLEQSEDPDVKSKRCIDWEVFRKAMAEPQIREGDELLEWEKELLDVMDVQE